MAINKITSKSIKDLELSADDLAPGTVTGAKIAPATVESSNIAPGTIANDRLANTGITINGTSIDLGSSGDIVAGTDWQAVTVADGSTTVNTVAGGGYLLDTNAGVIEAFLPTSPTRGDTVVLVDYSGTFSQNRVIVNTGGANIDSTDTGDVELTTNNSIVEFIYIDSSKGWLVKTNQVAGTTPSSAIVGTGYDSEIYLAATGGTVSTVDTNFKVHVFTGDGCFVVSQGNQNALVDYLVVAGGGGGGKTGAGGAGGVRHAGSTYCSYACTSPFCGTGLTLSVATYPVTVGGGGAGQPQDQSSFSTGPLATRGSNSVFSTITSAGGGAAFFSGPNLPKCTTLPATPGGSGASAVPSGDIASFGLGNTPPVSPPQGFDSGPTGTPNPEAGVNPDQGPEYSSVDGGGAGAGSNTNIAPTNGPSRVPGNAGRGFPTGFLVSCLGVTDPGVPPATRFIGGGGGGGGGASPTYFTTAIHGGGNGAGATPGTPGSANNGSPGTANTGGGGGGGGSGGGRSTAAPQGGGGTGGKGLVVIRYKFQ